jgi:hypothetical protein
VKLIKAVLNTIDNSVLITNLFDGIYLVGGGGGGRDVFCFRPKIVVSVQVFQPETPQTSYR